MRRFPVSWSTTLSKLGLKLVRRKPGRRRVRGGGYGRWSSIESLECRHLLTGSPWAGNDLIIGDFDGDGNLDRLGSMAVSTTDALVWNVDTKASSAAGTTESWRLISLKPLPQLNEFLVGDFNADGRDDILSRAGGSTWYMIQSRSTSNPAFKGEFAVYTSWGTIDAVSGWIAPIVGDFNGDGRDDVAAFNDSNPADKQWQVRISTGTSWELVAAWATQAPIAPLAGSTVAGDFNGDGRDDLLFKKSGTQNWAIAISDGSRFNVFDPASATTPWTAGHIGDFDGDGTDELLGWNSTGTPHWETVRYSDHSGMSLVASWGNHLGAIAASSNLHVGDANRDGRDDLVVFDTTANKWKVALSKPAANGTNTFEYLAAATDGTKDWDRWFKDWDWGPNAAPYKFLNVDAPYQKFLDIFSDVYNNVELELYPGFLKGLTAASQTKAANAWEQAALVVDRLETSGFSRADVDIASGNIEVPVALLKSWLGLESSLSVYNAIRIGLDGNAVALNNVGVDISGNSGAVINANLSKVRFRHAWVRAKVPTSLGWTSVDVDPSWKFKGLQPGTFVDMSGSASSYPGNRGTFDEFGYLAAGGEQLPLEYYEDRIAEYLAENNIAASLAEVPRGSRIIQQQFSKIPSGLASDITLVGNVTTYDNFDEIVIDPIAKAELTHRVEVSIQRDATDQKLRRTFSLDDISASQLPDYAGFEPHGITTVNFSSGSISSYGADIVETGVNGSVHDLRATANFPSEYPAYQGGPSPQFSGFSNFLASDYTSNFGTSPGELWFEIAAGIAIELSPSYVFSPSTKLEFDIEQSGSAGYNPTVAVGVTRYSTGTTPLPLTYDLYLVDGASYGYAGGHTVNVSPTSGSLSVSIPAGTFASDNPAQYTTRITILHSDNIVRGLRESGNQSPQNGSGRTTIRNLVLREETPYQFDLQGSDLVLTGTSYAAADTNYNIGRNTVLEFDFQSTSQGERHVIGWDTDGVPDDGSTDASKRIKFYGTDATESPYNGNGWQTIRIPLASYFAGSGTQQLGKLVFGVEGGSNTGATSFFRNVRLYDSSTEITGSDTARKIVQTGFTSKALPVSMTITKRTLLQFTFNVVQEGRFHGIGFDYDGTAGNGGTYDGLYYLSGTNPSGFDSQSISGGPFHGAGTHTISIPIGDYVGNIDWLDRLVFVTGGGQVEFSDISLVEGAEGTFTHWTQEIVVPDTPPDQSSHDIRIRYESSSIGPYAVYIPYLSFDGNPSEKYGSSNGFFFANEKSTIKVQHYFPTALARPSEIAQLNHLDTYSRTANQVHAFVLDANQYSSKFIAQLQGSLSEQQLDIYRRRVEGGSISNGEIVNSIGALLNYTGSKYWHEINRSAASIADLMRTLDVQPTVGSGLITSSSQWISDPNVGHLSLPNVPRDMNVDIQNASFDSIDIRTDVTSHRNEAGQLIGYNASALESAILEEVANTKSISTIRGLKEAYAAMSSGDYLWIFESRLEGGQRKIYRRGSIGTTPNANEPYEPTGGDERTIAQIRAGADDLTSHTQRLRDSVADLLENNNQKFGPANAVITVVVPNRKSVVDNWQGSAYVAEIGGGGTLYAIVPNNGPITYGGASGDKFKLENKRLSSGTFFNHTYAGDPVNVANGNMFRDEVDFKFANPIVPLDFSRHYDSQNKLDVGFGVGWVHSFTGFVYEEQDPANSGDVDYVWLRGSGERHTFESLDFTLPNTLFGDVEKDANGLTKFLDRSGTQFIFQPIAGGFNDTLTGKKIVSRLIAIKDATGSQGVTISYDDVGAVKSVRVKEVHSLSTPSRYLQFSYNGNNIEVKRYDAGQLISTWAYFLTTNANYIGKRLTQVKHANLTTNVTNYLYYDDGPASRRGLIKKITEPNLESHTYEYYANGRVFRVTDGAGNQQSFNYNLFRNLTEFTDENGNVETYIHQDNGLLTKQIHDDRSRLEYTWGPQSANNTVQLEEFLMRSSTDERGAKEEFTYRTYNSNNQYSRPGELQTSKSKDDILTTFTYDDSQAYVSSVTSVTETPLNGTPLPNTEYTYDMHGHILTAKDAAGHITKYEYYDSAAPAHLRGLRKSETLPKGVSFQQLAAGETYEAVPWQVLSSSFVITGDTISVQLRTPALGQYVIADAIRIDRIDKNGIYTRIIDSITSANDPNFRLGTGGGSTLTDGSDAYGGSYVRIAGTNPEQVGATWIFSNLEPGTYRISASWQFSALNSAAAKYSLFRGLPDGAPEATISGINQTVAPASFRSYQTLFEYDTAGNLTRSITEGLPSGRRAYDSFGNVVYEEDATGVAKVHSYDTLGRFSSSMILPSKQSMPLDKSSAVQSYHGGVSFDVDRESWEVLDGGSKLHLYGNTRKAISIGNYQVSQNTKLEFDFEAPVAGEWYGISIGNSLSTIHPATTAFKLYGTDPTTYGWNTSLNGQYIIGSGPKHYTIDLGAVVQQSGLTGPYYLIFTNADTMAGGVGPGQSYFSNIRLYESTSPSNQQRVDFPLDKSSSVLSYNGTGGWDASPNSYAVLNGGNTLYLYDGARKGLPINYQVTASTVLEFDFEAVGNLGEAQGIGISHNLNAVTSKSFALASTRTTPGWQPEWNWDFQNYQAGSGLKHYRIPIGTYVNAGLYEFLALVNYDSGTSPADGANQGRSYFSNIRLYESTGEGSVGRMSHIYDAAGRLRSTTDALSNRTTFEYDTAGRLVKTGFPDRTFTTHEYDDFGNCIATTDEIGRTTHYVYDDRNRLIQTIYPDGNSTRVRYDGSGQIVSSFDERGTETRFTYDKAGRLLTTITAPELAEEAKTVNKYDNCGRRVESVDANGVVTKYRYDDLDRLVQTTVLDKTHASPNDTTLTTVTTSKLPVHVSTIDYDSNGNIARTAVFDPRRFAAAEFATLLGNSANLIATPNESDNKVQVVRTAYDALGRVTKTTNSDGTSTSTIYDAAGRVRYTFDELGRKTEHQYDRFGRVEKTVYPDPDRIGPTESRYLRYSRNADGQVVEEFEYVGPGYSGDPTTHETSNYFAYDTRGRMTVRREKYLAMLTFFVYDPSGQLVSTVAPDKSADYSRFDKRGRVVATRLADPDGAGPQFAAVTTRTYDATGNVETSTDARGSKTTFSYDKLNQLKTETRYHELLLDDSSDANDVSFTVNTGTPYPQPRASSTGGDYTAVQSATATVTWTTGPLDAGTYRVSATWFANLFWASNATANVSKNGKLVAAPQIDQTNSPVGFEEVDGDVSRVWQILKDGIAVAAGDTISVQLVRNAGTYSYLLADAIRVDRETVTEYGYDKNGNLTSEKDSRGFTTRHFFDELGREKQTVSADPDGPGTPLFGLVSERAFDGYGNVVTERHGYQTSSSVDPYQIRRSDTFEYDRRNRLLKEVLNANADTGSDDNVTTQYGYDVVGNRTKVIDAEGFETRYRYDDANRQIDVYRQVKKNENTTPLSTLGIPTAVPGYNGSASRPNSTTILLTGNAWAYSQISTYQVTHRTMLEFDLDVANVPERLAIGFDTDGSRAGTTAENNRIFDLGGALQSLGDFVRDFRNLRLGEGPVHIQIPIGQYLTSAEKALTNGLAVSHLVFANLDSRSGLSDDDLGKSTFSNLRFFESDEVRTVTTYDTQGNVETVQEASDPRNITTLYRYDRLRRLVAERLDYGFTQQQATDYKYDDLFHLTSIARYVVGNETRVTSYEYDRLGRRIKLTLPDPDGNTATPNGLVTTFAYDVVGNLIAETQDATIPGQATKLITTRYDHDEQGNVVSKTDGNGDETRYRYDSEGNQTAVIDAEQNVTRYEYDGLNRVTKETITATVNDLAQSLTRTYGYKSDGKLDRRIDRNGRLTLFKYDDLDRKIEEDGFVGSTGASGITRALTWQYDKLGRVTKQADSNALVYVNGSGGVLNTSDDIIDTYVYDGLGRVTQQANYDPVQTNQGSSNGLPRVRQVFDYRFQTESNGTDFYERIGRTQFLVTQTTEMPIADTQSEYDRHGRLSNVTDQDAHPLAGPNVERKYLAFSYDALNNLRSIERRGNHNGSTWQNTLSSYLNYDNADRIRSLIHNLPTQIFHEFGYDNASRITGFNTYAAIGGGGRAYAYDDAGQLTSRSSSTGIESYTYDDNGNRVSVGGQTVVTGPANRVTSDGTYSYEYDKEGNATSKTLILDPGQRTYYVWDHRNRLTMVSEWNGDHEALIVDYKYDAANRLVAKATNRPFETGIVETEYFVHNSNGTGGDELALSFTKIGAAAATLEHRYLHGPAGQVLVDEVFNASGQSTDSLWLLGDHQGTPRDIVDDNGVLRKHTNYDSFGRVVGEQFYARNGTSVTSTNAEAVDQLFGYTGQERDEATGLQKHGARWYDPRTGRWLSEDPTGFDGGDANLYRYVGNSPLNYIDPSGTTQAGNPLSNLNLNTYSTLAESDNYFRNQLYSPSSLATSQGPSPYYVAAFQDAMRRYDLAQAQKIQQLYADADLNWRINDPILTNPRVQSTFTVLQGVGEATIATGLAAVPEPTLATKVGAGLLYIKSFDSLQAGVRGLYYGESFPTVTRNTVQSGAEHLGVPRAEASFIAGVADASPSIIGGIALSSIPRPPAAQKFVLGSQSTITYRNPNTGQAFGSVDQMINEFRVQQRLNEGRLFPEPAPSANRGIWDLSPEARWTNVEQLLGKNLPSNFPGIDRFDNGLATSIKSLDLGAPTYAKPAAIVRVGQRYIDKVGAFKGRTWNNITIEPGQITGRALDLAIPPNATTAQQAALQSLLGYGKQKSVSVNIVEVR